LLGKASLPEGARSPKAVPRAVQGGRPRQRASLETAHHSPHVTPLMAGPTCAPAAHASPRGRPGGAGPGARPGRQRGRRAGNRQAGARPPGRRTGLPAAGRACEREEGREGGRRAVRPARPRGRGSPAGPRVSEAGRSEEEVQGCSWGGRPRVGGGPSGGRGGDCWPGGAPAGGVGGWGPHWRPRARGPPPLSWDRGNGPIRTGVQRREARGGPGAGPPSVLARQSSWRVDGGRAVGAADCLRGARALHRTRAHGARAATGPPCPCSDAAPAPPPAEARPPPVAPQLRGADGRATCPRWPPGSLRFRGRCGGLFRRAGLAAGRRAGPGPGTSPFPCRLVPWRRWAPPPSGRGKRASRWGPAPLRLGGPGKRGGPGRSGSPVDGTMVFPNVAGGAGVVSARR